MGILDRLRNNSLEKEIMMDGETQINVNSKGEIVDIELNKELVITKDIAMKISALNEGVNMISDTIAALSIYLYKRNSDGSRKKVKDRRNAILNIENSTNSTAFNMKKTLVLDFLIHGNGYLDINKNADGTLKTLINIPHSDISLINTNDLNKRNATFRYNYWGMTNESYQVVNLVRNPKHDEVTGIGILKEGAISLREANALDEYSKNIISNGFNARGVIETEKIMSKVSRDSLSDMLKKFFSGNRNSGKVMILDDGLKFKSLSLSPADMNLLQQKNFTIEDIARLLKIPGYLLGATGSSMVYSNVEQTQLMYLQMTIEPILKLIENTFNKYLLTTAEKENGFFFEFNTQNMLRTTPEKELRMYNEAIKGSIFTVNEVRKKLNLARLDGMDRPILQSGMCIINEDGTIMSPSSNKHQTDETIKSLANGVLQPEKSPGKEVKK